MYAVRIGKADYLCSGSYIVHGERYQVIGSIGEARRFKQKESAINWIEKLRKTRTNVNSYEIIEL